MCYDNILKIVTENLYEEERKELCKDLARTLDYNNNLRVALIHLKEIDLTVYDDTMMTLLVHAIDLLERAVRKLGGET